MLIIGFGRTYTAYRIAGEVYLKPMTLLIVSLLGVMNMECPSCGAAELVRDTRDMPYTYKSESTLIPAVTGNFCFACGGVVLDGAESFRVNAAMLDFNKQVNASIALRHRDLP